MIDADDDDEGMDGHCTKKEGKSIAVLKFGMLWGYI